MQKNPQAGFYPGESINDEHVQFFQRNGVIHFKNFISKDLVKEFLLEIKSVESFFLSRKLDKVNGVPLKFGTDTDGATIIQRLAFTSQYSQVLSDFLKSDKIKALTTLLQPYDGRIGENEKDGLVVNHYINTDESKFSQLGWHTDSPRDLFLGSRILPMLNVGLHLDDCPSSNGGLRVLAGTHNKGLFTLFFKKKYFVDNNPDEKETSFEIEAGDLTIHDGRIWHRVQQSPHIGEQSRRRVMYIPIITGAYKPKHANSPTALYHKVAQIKLNPYGRKSKEKQAERNLIPDFNIPS